MRAGRLDRRITIEANTPTKDAAGEETDAWATFQEAWAERRQETGREYLAGQQERAEARVVFRTRWVAGVTPLMRVIYDGRAHDIVEVVELGRKEGLEIKTVLRVA